MLGLFFSYAQEVVTSSSLSWTQIGQVSGTIVAILTAITLFIGVYRSLREDGKKREEKYEAQLEELRSSIEKLRGDHRIQIEEMQRLHRVQIEEMQDEIQDLKDKIRDQNFNGQIKAVRHESWDRRMAEFALSQGFDPGPIPNLFD